MTTNKRPKKTLKEEIVDLIIEEEKLKGGEKEEFAKVVNLVKNLAMEVTRK